MSSLYEISAEMQELMDWLNDPETDEQAIADTLEGLQFELEKKAEGYCKVIRQFEADAEMFKVEAQIFQQKQTRAENNAKRMKEALMKAMVATGNEKGLDAGLFRLKIAGNGGKRPLKITGIVPDEFIKMMPTNDTDRIRDFLESLDENDSCAWAKLEDRGTHLSIK